MRAILRTSMGWDDRMITQSIMMIANAKAIQVINITVGALKCPKQKNNTIPLIPKEISIR
jgi:hypothetical protein